MDLDVNMKAVMLGAVFLIVSQSRNLFNSKQLGVVLSCLKLN